jgi:hypothetical protein
VERHLIAGLVLLSTLAVTTPPAAAQSFALESFYTEAAASSAYARTVDIDGDYAVVGDSTGIVAGQARGIAYVLQRLGNSWNRVATLTASNGALNDGFGGAVSISGSRIVVGAALKNGIRGAAYVFERSGSSWFQTAILTGFQSGVDAFFGTAVSVSGDRIAVGALGEDNDAGAIYTFRLNGTTWDSVKLSPIGGAQDGFGAELDLSGTTLCAGYSQSGRHAVFEFTTTWTNQANLTTPPGSPSLRACKVHQNTLLIGGAGVGGAGGAAFVWTRTGTAWSLQQQLVLPSALAYYGTELDLVGDTAVLGARGTASTPGAAYVFQRTGAAWAHVQTLSASAVANDGFATAVAFDGSTLIAGRPNSRGVFLYRRTATAPGAPGAPTNFQGTVTGNTVALSWNPPSSGGAPTGYALQVTGLGAVPVGLVTSFSSPAPNGSYTIAVVATNASGASAPSNSITLTVPQSVPAPGAPLNFAAGVSGSSVTFSWTPPASGGAVAGYTLLAGLTPGFTAPIASLSVPASATSLSVPGVPAGTYYARLIAQNSGGSSPASNEASLTVAGLTAPGAPTMNAPTVSGGVVSLSWTPGSGGAPVSYVLTARNGAGAVLGVIPATGTALSVPNVPSGTYLVSVAAVNAAGTSGASNQVTVTVP